MGSPILLDLIPMESPHSFRLEVTDDLCVGPPGNVFLFGGLGHAAAIKAMQQVLDRELVWSTAQFQSFARRGMMLDLEVHPQVKGHNISLATAVARVGDRTIFTASAAFGARSDQPSHQWVQMPAAPEPEQCIAWPIWPKQDGGFNRRVELRLPPGSVGMRARDGTVARDGRLLLWIKAVEDLPVDAALLAAFGDFVPGAAASAMGRIGGGNSLDNTLRLRALRPTRWVLCDIQMHASERGFAHGDMRLFAQDGTLMAIASQSLILRFLCE